MKITTDQYNQLRVSSNNLAKIARIPNIEYIADEHSDAIETIKIIVSELETDRSITKNQYNLLRNSVKKLAELIRVPHIEFLADNHNEAIKIINRIVSELENGRQK